VAPSFCHAITTRRSKNLEIRIGVADTRLATKTIQWLKT